MNDRIITDYVAEIFRNVRPSEKVTEQKEELVVNIRERVQDYMRDGLSFDAAFEAAKNTLGDTEELTAPFEKMRPGTFGSQTPPHAYAPSFDEGHGEKRVKVELGNWGLAMISPFAYVLIGLLQNSLLSFTGWFPLNWWSWGWVIMPISGIICIPGIDWIKKLGMFAPFVYVLIGLLQNDLSALTGWFPLNWWAFGWVIIPLAGLISSGVIKVTRE